MSRRLLTLSALSIVRVSFGILVASNAMAQSSVTNPVYPVTDTSQNACYDNNGLIDCPAEGEAFFGQDAQHEGTAPSFNDNGNGTVADNVTGLVWQQAPSEERMGWSDAQAYCAALELSGSNNWRLPNLKELFGLNDFSQGWPYLDAAFFTLNGRDKDQQFWTSNFYEVGTTHDGAPSAFGVNHITGHIKAYPAEAPDAMPQGQAPPPPRSNDGSKAARPGGAPPAFGKLARCVLGEEIGQNAFTDNGDGTVTDSATALMWSQSDAGKDMNWEDALSYAEAMNQTKHLGYDDWRLPNIHELQSIVDYSGNFPAINATYFEWTEADRYFWSSTSAYFNAQKPEYIYAWYVAFGYAPGPDGEDVHGAGAVRFIGKAEDSPAAEGDYRPLNSVRLVRDAD